MCNLRHYLWITISVSALAILASNPALAKPQVRSKVIKPVVTSQVSPKVVVDDAISPQPVEAILANIRIKPSATAQAVRTGQQKAATTKSVTAVGSPARNGKADLSSKGIANFVGTNPPKSQPNKAQSKGIDQWIDD
jgi:hypothetical protein